MSGPPRAARLALHLALLLWYLFILSRNLGLSERHPGAATYGGRWKYLTFLDLVLQAIFFGICVLMDLLALAAKRGRRLQSLAQHVNTLQDRIFTNLAFPVGSFVVLSFWLLYVYDRELVYPREMDDIIPQWLNHAMHSVILMPLLMEVWLVSHHYPSRVSGLVMLSAFCSLYLIWVMWIHSVSGIWVYPILAKLNPVAKVVFLAVAVISTAPLYLLGEKLEHIRWGNVHWTQKIK
ncbi:androgen-induced gene 1 protein [Callorhinchus milii]|nr:androgen-induced gene 1 protein [Callorhinchus milii]|eukprot:gi/632939657/ref/XP_007882691.1/ PREDICTED: androgen-induced gene 1 protein-like [Callorhinchus milii]